MARAWHNFIRPIIGRFRKQRGGQILKIFPALDQMRVLDLGGSVHFWFETGLIDHVREVVIYNISADEVDIANQANKKLNFKIYDGVNIPENDLSFDLVLSNSVLEHIPLTGRAQVSKEMMRVGKHGFIQTPAYEFPIEPHFVLPFIHWFPRCFGRYLVRLSPWAMLSNHSAAVQDAYFSEVQLLTKRNVSDLFPHRTIFSERFLGLTKAWLVTW
ncbi:MAG: class I SAM-dependent methyltransferase [Candidatus Methylumidiphilus sp.]